MITTLSEEGTYLSLSVSRLAIRLAATRIDTFAARAVSRSKLEAELMNLLQRLRTRRTEPEILDSPVHPEATVLAAYRSVAFIQRLLGIPNRILQRIRSYSPFPHRVVDIGCGDGCLAEFLATRATPSVIGVDVRPIYAAPCRLPILRIDATRDPIPRCDVAVAVLMVHHLDDEGVIRLLRNTARSCRRLLIVDLIRHPIPYVLFRCLLKPWIHPVAATDGQHSIERAFTTSEMSCLITRALDGIPANVTLRWDLLRRWQMAEIQFL